MRTFFLKFFFEEFLCSDGNLSVNVMEKELSDARRHISLLNQEVQKISLEKVTLENRLDALSFVLFFVFGF